RGERARRAARGWARGDVCEGRYPQVQAEGEGDTAAWRSPGPRSPNAVVAAGSEALSDLRRADLRLLLHRQLEERPAQPCVSPPVRGDLHGALHPDPVHDGPVRVQPLAAA